MPHFSVCAPTRARELGTGIAYVLYYYLVRRMGAVQASTVRYLPPVVALLIGLFVGEPLHAMDLIAMGEILGGVYVIQTSGAAREQRAPNAAAGERR